MARDTHIGPRPPQDGRDWDCCCARCGGEMDFIHCGDCGGEGVAGHDCGEDACMCLRPEDNVACGSCAGAGGWHCCINSPAFCQAHPIKGREDTERDAVEWFPLEAPR